MRATQEDDVWCCPWCGEIANPWTGSRVLCEARACVCGAVGLTAPIRDSDEIIDDAAGIFGIKIYEASKGFNDLTLADLAQNGIEVRGGALQGSEGWPFPERRWMWFRKASRDGAPRKLPFQHVFVSYVREDTDAVDRLCDALRTGGVYVWLDREQIKPGERWQDAIRAAIQDGAFFLAVFSKASMSRARSYQNEELSVAIDELRKRPTDRAWFIPICLSLNAVPRRSIGGGQDLTNLQWVDLSADWNGGITRILGVINPRE